MKKVNFLFPIISVLFLASCATKVDTTETVDTTKEITSEAIGENAVSETENPENLSAEPDAFEKFEEIWNDTKLSVIEAPKEIINGQEFSSPYVVSVLKNGNPVKDAEILVSYPFSKSVIISDKENNLVADNSSNAGKDFVSVIYEKTIIKTDASGNAEFYAPKANLPFYSEVIFSPYFDCSGEDSNQENAGSENIVVEKISEASEKMSVKAPYRVKTNMMMKGGAIAIVDYNSKGKPILENSVSSSFLLKALMNKGFKGIGNADFSSTITNSLSNEELSENIYKEAKNLFGSSYSFLIFGSIKYVSPVSKETIENTQVYSCTLKGEIFAINMKTGALLLHAEKEISSSDVNDWNVLPNARKALAEEFSEAIVYGL